MDFSVSMIGRTDSEEANSNIFMNAGLPPDLVWVSGGGCVRFLRWPSDSAWHLRRRRSRLGRRASEGIVEIKVWGLFRAASGCLRGLASKEIGFSALRLEGHRGNQGLDF